MPTVIEMRRERARLWEEAKGLHERARAEKRAMSAEEQEQWDRINAEIDRLKGEIDREERSAAMDAEMAAQTAATAAGEGRDDGQPVAVTATPEYRDAFRSYLLGGIIDLTPEQRQVLQKGQQTLEAGQARALGVAAGPIGGFTVADEAMKPIIDARQAVSGVRDANVTVLTTQTGAELPVPLNDDTAHEGQRVGENTQITEDDPDVGQKRLRAYLYTSRIVRVPFQFIQDTSISDFEAWLGRIFGRRIGRITNREFTNGLGGGNEPEGLLQAAVLGATTAAAGLIAANDLVELEHSVDPDYRRGAQWMMHDQTLKQLKQLQDGMMRPLWLPGLAMREADTILGYPYVINQHFPAPGAAGWVGGGTERAMAFGDMSAYWVRDVVGMTVMRMQERYADWLQVGFLAYSRHDGALLDAGTHPIRYLLIQ